MNMKSALKSAFAFALALIAGHFIFSGRASQPALNSANAVLSSGVMPDTLASFGQTSAPAGRPRLPGGRQPINRDIVKVDNGFKNTSGAMTTTFADSYLVGIEHIAPHRNLKLTWKPVSQEIRQGTKVLDVQMASASDAHLEEHGGLKHVVYPSTYAETDEHLYVHADGGVEHDIILKKQPPVSESYGLAFSGYLNMGDGLTLWDGKMQITEDYATKGSLAFKDRNGVPVFFLREPMAFDASVTTRSGSFDLNNPAGDGHAVGCEYQVTFDSKGVKLAVVTPGKWLADAGRSYPVTIDPNLGPNGLSDGNPPVYTGSVSTGVLIPLAGDGITSGGARLAIEEQCAASPKNDDGYGHISMPFDFTYYGVTYRGPNNPNGPANNFYVHIDGWGSWDNPTYKYCDELPCNVMETPCFDYPQAANSFGAIPNGAYPVDGAVYALWNDLRFSSDPACGIYYLVDGFAPTRRLIVEWHRMAYFRDNNTKDIISFNLILYECTNQIDIIIGDVTNGNQYHGNSTIGIESVGDTKAAFYDTYLPPQLGAQASTDLTGLLVSFTLDTLSSTKITITPTPTSGTIPFAVQYLASTLVVQNPNCPLDAVPGNIAYHWTFGDGGEAFSASGTHTYVLPNNYSVANLTLPMLRATDGSGAFITLPFAVIAADIPPVSMTVEPQGGAAPLQIKVNAVSTSPFAPILIQPGTVRTIDAFVTDASLPLTTAIQIDKLGSQNEPGQSTLFVVTKGGTQTTIPAPSETSAKATTIQDVISSTYLLDEPGSYRITGIFPATSFTFPTIGKGVVYVDVTDPNSSVSNSLIITQSNLYINWSGKTKNKLGVAPKPASDTISLSGYINLVGLDLSTLAGQQITLALNAFNPIFQGTLDANGNASQGDATTGNTGNFSISMPSGKFTCNVTGDYAASLALTSQNLITLLTAHYRVQIGTVFNSPGTSISYGYQSIAAKQAHGNYTFGKFYTNGSFYRNQLPGTPVGSGHNGGQELLISGGFLVTSADFILQGDTVNVTINGLMARSGGDDLRPSATSNVIVKVGNSTQTLNFSTTPTFKTSGLPPTQRFSFKSKGGSNIKTLNWSNKAGTFQITAANLPNAQVGIDPQKGRQPIGLSFTVTPDSNSQFIGTTTFDLIKVSDTEFKH